MADGNITNPTDQAHRRRPAALFNARGFVSASSQIGLALLVFSALGWLIWRGALAMEYNWQWYRVEPFFYKSIDGEIIWGPLVRGLIHTAWLHCCHRQNVFIYRRTTYRNLVSGSN